MLEHKNRWSRVQRYGQAEVAQWERLLENPEVKSAVQKIQAEFHLPLTLGGENPLFVNPGYVDWMGWDDEEKAETTGRVRRRNVLNQRIGGLLRKYGIPERFFGSMKILVMTGKANPSYRTGGYPTFTYGRDTHGQWKHECVLTPETDLGNPLILESIRYWQTQSRIPPPRPIQRGRTKDWRPVWEWRHRNPDVPDRKIAEYLHVNRVTLSRAMEALDKEHATKTD